LQLVTIGGIAERLGVTRQRADQLSREVGFPRPAHDGGVRLWRIDEVRAWAKANGRRWSR
jgi:predicted DNA-binding transcriptional regulator AlpA